MTPFVAISSNSWKIETLVSDLGINPQRVVAKEAIETMDLSPDKWVFSNEEMTQIETTLAQWRTAADAMFDDIAKICQVKA